MRDSESVIIKELLERIADAIRDDSLGEERSGFIREICDEANSHPLLSKDKKEFFRILSLELDK